MRLFTFSRSRRRSPQRGATTDASFRSRLTACAIKPARPQSAFEPGSSREFGGSKRPREDRFERRGFRKSARGFLHQQDRPFPPRYNSGTNEETFDPTTSDRPERCMRKWGQSQPERQPHRASPTYSDEDETDLSEQRPSTVKENAGRRSDRRRRRRSSSTGSTSSSDAGESPPRRQARSRSFDCHHKFSDVSEDDERFPMSATNHPGRAHRPRRLSLVSLQQSIDELSHPGEFKLP